MRVLVTRPLPQAERTAVGLRSLGHEPAVLPLTAIEPLPPVPRPEWFSVGLVALTSANALASLSPEFLDPYLTKPCYAVGAATVQAANEAGFRDVMEGPGDAAGLAALIAGNGDPQATILYFCGRVRMPGFEAALEQAGRRVYAAETYDTARVLLTEGETDRVFAAPFGAVLLHSTLAAEALAGLMAQAGVQASLADAVLICLSRRVAAALPQSASPRIRIASAPNEDALLTLLPLN